MKMLWQRYKTWILVGLVLALVAGDAIVAWADYPSTSLHQTLVDVAWAGPIVGGILFIVIGLCLSPFVIPKSEWGAPEDSDSLFSADPMRKSAGDELLRQQVENIALYGNPVGPGASSGYDSFGSHS